IAAQARGAGPSARHGVVAADGFRVGAVEQLRLYADIIGAPFAVARSGEELTRALGDLRRRPILVDTAGRSPRDEGAADILDALAPLVDVLATSGLPVSYLAHGQNVPDDLHRATPRRLTEWVLGDSECGACA